LVRPLLPTGWPKPARKTAARFRPPAREIFADQAASFLVSLHRRGAIFDLLIPLIS
jgi:hypothetical protein